MTQWYENVGINQRPLRQKCNLNNIFHEHKGNFATTKRALLKTCGDLTPLPPPFLRPCVHLSSDLKWPTYIDHIYSKASKRLFALRILRHSGVPPNDLCSVFGYFIRPLLEYACPVWHSSLPISLCQQVEDIQQRALRIYLD